MSTFMLRDAFRNISKHKHGYNEWCFNLEYNHKHFTTFCLISIPGKKASNY